MNYTVEWAPMAVEELAAAWLSSAHRSEVSRFAHLLEHALATAPFRVGSAYGSSVLRMVFTPCLGAGFYIVEDDKKVIVQTCWRVG